MISPILTGCCAETGAAANSAANRPQVAISALRMSSLRKDSFLLTEILARTAAPANPAADGRRPTGHCAAAARSSGWRDENRDLQRQQHQQAPAEPHRLAAHGEARCRLPPG